MVHPAKIRFTADGFILIRQFPCDTIQGPKLFSGNIILDQAASLHGCQFVPNSNANLSAAAGTVVPMNQLQHLYAADLHFLDPHMHPSDSFLDKRHSVFKVDAGNYSCSG